MERLSIWIKLLIVGSICIAVCAGVYFGLNHKIKDNKNTLSDLKSESIELEKNLASVKDDYEKLYNDAYKDVHDADYNKVKVDEKILETLCKLAFEYDSSDAYDNNRKEALKYLSANSDFMKDVFFENDSYKNKAGEEHTIIEDMGFLMKLNAVDIYHKPGKTSKGNDEYYVIVKSTPYFGKDINAEESLKKETFIINATIDKNSKIKKFDCIECDPQV